MELTWDLESKRKSHRIGVTDRRRETLPPNYTASARRGRAEDERHSSPSDCLTGQSKTTGSSHTAHMRVAERGIYSHSPSAFSSAIPVY